MTRPLDTYHIMITVQYQDGIGRPTVYTHCWPYTELRVHTEEEILTWVSEQIEEKIGTKDYSILFYRVTTSRIQK